MSSFGFDDDNHPNQNNQGNNNQPRLGNDNQQIEMQNNPNNHQSNFGNEDDNFPNDRNNPNQPRNNQVGNNPNGNDPNNLNGVDSKDEAKKKVGLSLMDRVRKNKLVDKDVNIAPEAQIESNISRDFRKIFQTENQNEQVNNKRRLVMNFSVFYMIFSTVVLEVLCLYLGCCLGEQIELEYYLSHSIIPLFIILIFLNYLIYTAADYVLRSFMKIIFAFLFVYSGFFLGFGIYALVKASQVRTDNTLFNSRWNQLSLNSRLFYFSNVQINLVNAYFGKMITTGVIYIFTGVISILDCFFLWDYNDKISDNWIPLLKSRMSDDNKKRLIDLKNKLSPNEGENLRQNINDERKPLIDGHISGHNAVGTNLDNLDNNGLNMQNSIENNNKVNHEHVESNQFNRSETDAKLNAQNMQNHNLEQRHEPEQEPQPQVEKKKKTFGRKIKRGKDGDEDV